MSEQQRMAIRDWTEDELWIARTALYEFAETERDAADDYRVQGRHAEAAELHRHAEVAERLRLRLSPPAANGSQAPDDNPHESDGTTPEACAYCGDVWPCAGADHA